MNKKLTFNKHFHTLVRHLDPNGILHLPMNVYNDEKYLLNFYITNNDYQELDMPWMCDQLITLLANFETLAVTSSTLQFLKTDFQQIHYPIMMICQAFIGLIIIQKNSVEAFYSYSENSKLILYKNKIFLDDVLFRKRKRKSSDPTYRPKKKIDIRRQNIESLNQNPIVLLNIKTDSNYKDIPWAPLDIPMQLQHSQNTILTSNNQEIISNINRISGKHLPLHIQPIEEFPIFNENLIIENPSLLKNNLEQPFVDIDTLQSEHKENQLAIEQSQCMINILNHQINAEQFYEQSKDLHLQEQHNLISVKNQQNLPLKRKRSNGVVKKNVRKKPIQQSRKVLKNRLKKLEGELPNRPFEFMALKYIHQSMNHLPLRHEMYHNKLNIPFAIHTLHKDLEEKDQDDIFNDEIDLRSYKLITEKLNNDISNICIYQQSMNNFLPHLSFIPQTEESLTNNSSLWRNKINEINKKLEDDSKGISPIFKIDQSKLEEFGEKMMQKINKSLIAQKSLIGPKVSRTNLSEISNLILSPAKSPILLACDKSPLDQIQEYDVDPLNQTRPQNFQNVIESNEVYQKQSIDVMQMISNILSQSPKETSAIKFTDLCPVNITNRRKTISVFLELLRLQKRRIVNLSQSFGVQDPSSITIKLN